MQTITAEPRVSSLLCNPLMLPLPIILTEIVWQRNARSQLTQMSHWLTLCSQNSLFTNKIMLVKSPSCRSSCCGLCSLVYTHCVYSTSPDFLSINLKFLWKIMKRKSEFMHVSIPNGGNESSGRRAQYSSVSPPCNRAGSFPSSAHIKLISKCMSGGLQSDSASC